MLGLAGGDAGVGTLKFDYGRGRDDGSCFRPDPGWWATKALLSRVVARRSPDFSRGWGDHRFGGDRAQSIGIAVAQGL